MADKEVQKQEEDIKDKEQQVEQAAAEAGKEAGKKAEAEGASPEEVQTAVERARKEEKDKLYPQIEGLRNDLKDVQKILKAEQDDKERIKKEAQAQAEKERQSKLSDQERTNEILSKLEEKLRDEETKREAFERSLEERDRKDQLRRYKERLIQAHKDEIIEEIVQGDSVEELDESLEKAKARFKEFEEKYAQKHGKEVKHTMSRSANPDTDEALWELESKDLSQLDTDKYLEDPAYRQKIQSQLENEYARAAGRK